MSDSTLLQLIIFLVRVKSSVRAAAGEKRNSLLPNVYVPVDDCISNCQL